MMISGEMKPGEPRAPVLGATQQAYDNNKTLMAVVIMSKESCKAWQSSYHSRLMASMQYVNAWIIPRVDGIL